MKKVATDIYLLEGTSPGPIAAVQCVVHGDETLGYDIVQFLLQHLTPNDIAGKLYLSIANRAAYNINKRCVDTDMNRLLTVERQENLLKQKTENLNIEEKRVLEIVPFLRQCDYLLDLHSTSKPSTPFIYCEATQKHLALTQKLDIQYIVSPAEAFRTPAKLYAFDNYVDRHGGLGFTYEAGQHGDQSLFEHTLLQTKVFLHQIGVLKEKASTEVRPQTHVLVHSNVPIQTKEFKFTADYANFDVVPAHTIIAYDGDQAIEVQHETVIVFPSKKTKQGTIAADLGRIAS